MCLIFNVYVCACESMPQCVKVRRCVFIWDRLFKSEFIRIYICVCDSMYVCVKVHRCVRIL